VVATFRYILIAGEGKGLLFGVTVTPQLLGSLQQSSLARNEMV